MAKFKVSLGIGYVNGSREDVIEVDDTELDECQTEDERNSLLDEYWQDWANNYIEGGMEKA